MKAQLEQVIIFCADVEKLVKFYADHFGLTAVGEIDSHWAVLQAGPAQIAFHKMGDQYLPNPPDAVQTRSNIKLVFRLEVNLELFRQQLIDQRVEMGEIKQFPGFAYRVCDGRDPEGNVFQLLENI